MINLIISGIKETKVMAAVLFIPTMLVISAAIMASYYLDIPISKFTRDPMAIVGGHPLYGVLSNLGIILWSSSAAICFFTYINLNKCIVIPEVRKFILFGGIISTVLLLDDLFMFHESIFPLYFGVDQKVVLLFYGLLILYYLVNFRDIILESNFIFIMLFCIFIGLSILIDLLPDTLLPWHHLFEDGTKFIAIVSWFGYQFFICSNKLNLTSDNTVNSA